MWRFSLNMENHFANLQNYSIGLIPLTARKFYTDTDGSIIDKATLPANLQTDMPLYLLGKNDMDSSFRAATQLVPVNASWTYYLFSIGSQYTFLDFTGLNNIRTQISSGDLVFIYVDNYSAPTYYCWVIVSIDQKPAATVIANADGTEMIENVIISTSNVNQFLQKFTFIKVTKFGDYSENTIGISTARDPYVVLEDQALLNISFLFSPENGLCTRLLFATDSMTFELKFKPKK